MYIKKYVKGLQVSKLKDLNGVENKEDGMCKKKNQWSHKDNNNLNM